MDACACARRSGRAAALLAVRSATLASLHARGTDARIAVRAGTYTVTDAAGENANATGDVDPRSDLVIEGAGARLIINTAGREGGSRHAGGVSLGEGGYRLRATPRAAAGNAGTARRTAIWTVRRA
jgi:hypothetical protein